MNSILKLFMVPFTLLSICVLVPQCKQRVNEPAATTETIIDVTDTVDVLPETMDTAAASAKTPNTRNPLVLTISNLQSATAPIIIGLYGTNNDFPNPKDQLKKYKFKPNGKQATFYIKDLKFGVYALAIYQDENNDGKIDKNLIGVPTEGYAFSNNYKPIVKAPSFSNCQFEYSQKSNSVNMTILR